MKVDKAAYEEAVELAKRLLKKGDHVYGIVRSVAKSGTSRTNDFYVIVDNQPVYLSNAMAHILGVQQVGGGALKITGCGMDMIFACVYELSRRLFDDGYALKHDSL